MIFVLNRLHRALTALVLLVFQSLVYWSVLAEVYDVQVRVLHLGVFTGSLPHIFRILYAKFSICHRQ